MKHQVLLLNLLLPLLSFSQTREEVFDFSYKPTKNAGYYFVVTEKKDSLFHQKAYYLSQKTLYMDGWFKDEAATVQHGSFKWYHTNGSLQRTGQYLDGKKEGVWLRYDDEGRLQDSSHYNLDRRKGISMGWHKTGYPSDSTNFDGAGNGVQVRWYDDGFPSAAGRWVQDTLKRGRWQYFHRNGNVMATEDYDARGQLTDIACFDENGVALDTSLCREKQAMVDKDKWRRHLERALLPLIEKKAAQGISGNFTVVVRFIVDLNGNLDDVRALTKYGHGIEEGVIDILKKGPAWTPGSVHGKKVKSYHTQPVTFQIN